MTPLLTSMLKIKSVIESCVTEPQLDCASKFLSNWYKQTNQHQIYAELDLLIHAKRRDMWQAERALKELKANY